MLVPIADRINSIVPIARSLDPLHVDIGVVRNRRRIGLTINPSFRSHCDLYSSYRKSPLFDPNVFHSLSKKYSSSFSHRIREKVVQRFHSLEEFKNRQVILSPRDGGDESEVEMKMVEDKWCGVEVVAAAAWTGGGGCVGSGDDDVVVKDLNGDRSRCVCRSAA
ncbi:hypothetical protein Tco_0407189 [Tanacetum coccineum]